MRAAVAVAAALLATSAQGSQIYTFESTTPGVLGQLQLVDGAARSGLFVGTSLSELGGGVERFEFTAGGATLRTPAGGGLLFSTSTFEGAINACCTLTLDIAGRSAEWFGTYSVFGGARQAVTGRWVLGTGSGQVPLPGTLPLMALASFGIAGALRRRKSQAGLLLKPAVG